MSSMRKALACLVCITIVCSMVTGICAANYASVKPLYDNARRVDCTHLTAQQKAYRAKFRVLPEPRASKEHSLCTA